MQYKSIQYIKADAILEMEQRDFAREALEYVCLIQVGAKIVSQQVLSGTKGCQRAICHNARKDGRTKGYVEVLALKIIRVTNQAEIAFDCLRSKAEFKVSSVYKHSFYDPIVTNLNQLLVLLFEYDFYRYLRYFN